MGARASGGRQVRRSGDEEGGAVTMNQPDIDRLDDRIINVLVQIEQATNDKERRLLRERVPPLCEEGGDAETRRRLYETYLHVSTLVIGHSDLKAFRAMRIMEGDEWELTFSIDVVGGAFPQVRWGKTPQEERMYFQGVSEAFETLAKRAWEARRGTGRFFISERGVFYKENTRSATRRQVLRFEFHA